MKTKGKIIIFWILVSSCDTIGLSGNGYSYSGRSTGFEINLKVYKIDSINNFYLIYGRKGKSLFKIVSKKEVSARGKPIRLNGKYEFSLTSIWNAEIIINGVNVSPSHIPAVNCLAFDSATYICLERDSITDLYHAYNVKGLCWIKK